MNPATALAQLINESPSTQPLIIVPGQRTLYHLQRLLPTNIQDYSMAIETVAKAYGWRNTTEIIDKAGLDTLIQHIIWIVASEMPKYHYLKHNLDLPAFRRLITTYFSYHQNIVPALKQDPNGRFLCKVLEQLQAHLKQHNLQLKQQYLDQLTVYVSQQLKPIPGYDHVYALLATTDVPYIRRFVQWLAQQENVTPVAHGIDMDMPLEIWSTLSETHPQYQYIKLLEALNLARDNVKSLGPELTSYNQVTKTNQRQRLSAAMYPAAFFSDALASILSTDKKHTSDSTHIHLYECTTVYDEARFIAKYVQKLLQPVKIGIITEHRTLVRILKVMLASYNITTSDSVASTLLDTPCASLLKSIWQLVQDPIPNAIDLLSVLENSLVTICPHEELATWQLKLRNEEGMLAWEELLSAPYLWLQQIASGILQIKQLYQTDTAEHRRLMDLHFTLARQLMGESEPCSLLDLQNKITASTKVELYGNYAQCLEHYLAQQEMTQLDLTKQVQILSLLESRYQSFDVVIIPGLNEGTMPNSNTLDASIITPVTANNLGFNQRCEEIALMAHDFYMQLYSNQVILTRATEDNGIMTQPSRWLERLRVLQLVTQVQDPSIAEFQQPQPISAPAPLPPLEVRPTSLSSSSIELLMRDPYSFYVRYILKLRPLPELGANTQPRNFGIALHAALAKVEMPTINTDYNTYVKQVNTEFLRNLAPCMRRSSVMLNLWNRQLHKMLYPLYQLEIAQQATLSQSLREVRRELKFQGGTAVCTIADRLDIHSNHIVVYDYKTGAIPSMQDVRRGLFPQLIIAALTYESDLQRPVKMAYLALSLRYQAKLLHEFNIDLQLAHLGLNDLLTLYYSAYSTFIALPTQDNKLRDYQYIRREQEWEG